MVTKAIILMKRSCMIFIAITVILWPIQLFGQQISNQQISRIASFTKVWGFLKYYHPGISNGNIDWDSVFVTMLPQIIDSNFGEFNNGISDLINGPGEIQSCPACEDIRKYPKEWIRNLNLDWIDEDALLTDSTASQLHYVFNNRYQGEGYYVAYVMDEEAKQGPVKFTNEKEYNDSLLMNDYRYRLLALARYWNAIEYFFAYKYLLSYDWNQTLQVYIPIFYKKTTLIDYNMNITSLTRKIEDSHAGGAHSRYLLTHLWDKKPPFDIITINDKTLVNDIISEELNKINDIEIGDEILEIDSMPVEEARAALYDFCKGSNERNSNRAIDSQLLFGHTDTSNLAILRNGEKLYVPVVRYPFRAYWNIKQEEDPVCIVKDNYAIIDLGLMNSKEQIDSVMKIAKEKDAIIVDLRHHLGFIWEDLEAHFVDERIPGFRAFEPSLNDIGTFKPYIADKMQLDERENYNGKIIVLVNEFTQSYGESCAMFFQRLPSSIVVGSQTAGANGNTAQITLPGKINARFSNIIIEYPDGRQSQKTGIQLDYQVELTIEDILNEKDPYIEKAEEVLKNSSGNTKHNL